MPPAPPAPPRRPLIGQQRDPLLGCGEPFKGKPAIGAFLVKPGAQVGNGGFACLGSGAQLAHFRRFNPVVRCSIGNWLKRAVQLGRLDRPAAGHGVTSHPTTNSSI